MYAVVTPLGKKIVKLVSKYLMDSRLSGFSTMQILENNMFALSNCLISVRVSVQIEMTLQCNP